MPGQPVLLEKFVNVWQSRETRPVKKDYYSFLTNGKIAQNKPRIAIAHAQTISARQLWP